MKKIVAMALCLVMVLGLMAGCQKAMDVQTLTQKMDEAMKTITAQAADAQMELEMQMSTMGITMNIAMDMDMNIKAKADLSAMYMDMKMAMEAMGQSEEMTMQMYATMEDGAMVMYAYESESESWIKYAMDDYAEMMEQFSSLGLEQSMSQLPKESLTLAEEQITVNDRKCYVLTAAIDGAYIKDTMGQYMDEMMAQTMGTEEMDEESKAEFEAMMESLDWSKLGGQIVYHVDAGNFLPLEMTMEITGLGDVFNDMISAVMADAMMEMDEETPAFAIEVPTFKINMKNMTYNEAVEIPAIPQEAIDNAIDADAMMDYEDYEDYEVYEDVTMNQPQADGSYLMQMESNTVSVMVPDGYIVYNADDEMVIALTEEMTSGLYYMLAVGITDDEIQAGFMDNVTFAQEEDYYKSHTEVAELNGFRTMSLVYNDNTSYWCAWKELDGCILLLEAQVEGETFDLAALIDTVVLGE